MRTAVITGGSSGIGLAVARELTRRGGWQLLLAARRTAPLEQAAAELSATAVECDVTDDASVAALVAAAQAAGGCDLLVHSAGAPARAAVLEADIGLYRAALELHYIGLVRVATAFWPLLEASRGRLVPIVSVAGTVALAPSAPYAVAKHATLSWARSYGAAAREHGVAVTIVNPGPVPRRRVPAARAPAQPLGAVARDRRRALRGANTGGGRPACARGLRAAVVAPAAALQGVSPALTARIAARAWRHEPRVRSRDRARQ